jgi:hypothetical protein
VAEQGRVASPADLIRLVLAFRSSAAQGQVGYLGPRPPGRTLGKAQTLGLADDPAPPGAAEQVGATGVE